MLVDFLIRRKLEPVTRLIKKYNSRILSDEGRKRLMEWMTYSDENFDRFRDLCSLEKKKARYRSFSRCKTKK